MSCEYAVAEFFKKHREKVGYQQKQIAKLRKVGFWVLR